MLYFVVEDVRKEDAKRKSVCGVKCESSTDTVNDSTWCVSPPYAGGISVSLHVIYSNETHQTIDLTVSGVLLSVFYSLLEPSNDARSYFYIILLSKPCKVTIPFPYPCR